MGKERQVLKSSFWKWIGIVALGAMAPAIILWARPASHSARGTLSENALHARILRVVRERYSIAQNVEILMSPFESSQNQGYYECAVTVNNPNKKGSQVVSISKNGHYLAMSPMFYLGPDTSAEVVRNVRAYFKLGPEWHLTAGPLRDSSLSNFYQTEVTAENNGQKKGSNFFVTKDKHFLVLGPVYIIRSHDEVEQMINKENQPCSGPANAPVTIVEYADLECPSCARLQPFLENELLPRYGNKVRLIYKDFPLPMHTWARKAAIASQCVYQVDSSAFARYRTLVFAHQSEINVTNARDQLLQLAEQAGINRLKLAACMDSNASLSRVEQDVQEGNKLQVMETPTCFINGRMVAGLQPPNAYYEVIDADLQHDGSGGR